MSPWIGAAVPRKEDRRMLLGRGRFVDDLARPGLLHAAFVRSPHAHARVTRDRRGRRGRAAGRGRRPDRRQPGPPVPARPAGTGRVRAHPDAHPGRGDGPLRRRAGRAGRRRRSLPGRGRGRAGRGGLGPAARRDEHRGGHRRGAPRLHAEADGNCLVDLLMFDDDRLPAIFAAADRHRQRHLRQRPGRGAAPGGPGLPGRMGRPRRPARAARLHPGPAPGPLRASRRPSACPSGRSG